MEEDDPSVGGGWPRRWGHWTVAPPLRGDATNGRAARGAGLKDAAGAALLSRTWSRRQCGRVCVSLRPTAVFLWRPSCFFAGHLICISTPRQRPVPASSDDRQLGRPSSETAARRPHRRRDEAPPGQRRRRLQRRRRRRRDQRRLPVADARRRRRCRQRRRVQRRRRRPRHAVQSEERRRRRRQERRRRRRRSLLLHFGYFKSPTGGASDVDDAGVIHRYHHRIHSKIKLSTDLQYIFTTRIRSFRGFCPGFT